jgi:hypothetical protein
MVNPPTWTRRPGLASVANLFLRTMFSSKRLKRFCLRGRLEPSSEHKGAATPVQAGYPLPRPAGLQ